MAKGMAEEQPAWVPKFTRKGFEKTKIPADVYAMLLWEYERQKTSIKDDTLNGHNSDKIINNKKKAQSSIKNMKKTYLIELRFCSQLLIFNTDLSSVCM